MTPDTIRIGQYRRLTTDNFQGSDWTINWISEDKPGSTVRPDGVAAEPKFIIFHNQVKNLRLRGKQDRIETISLPSLPSLLYGHNGISFKHLGDYRLAFQILDVLLSEISEPEGLIHDYRRLDIAFQFYGNFASLEDALRHYRPPRGRKGISSKDGESIRFDFKGLQVEFYSKSRKFKCNFDRLAEDQKTTLKDLEDYIKSEASPCESLIEIARLLRERPPADDVIRCEVRFMTKRMIDEYFGNQLIEKGPSPMLFHHVIKNVLRIFFPEAAKCFSPEKLSKYQMLNLLQKHEPDRVKLYLEALNPKAMRRTLAAMRSCNMPKINELLKLETLLPKDRPPMPVDIWPRKINIKAPRLEEIRMAIIKGKMDPRVYREYGKRMHPFVP